MNYLERNIKGLCQKFGLNFDQFLDDFEAEGVNELTIFDLEAICEEYEVDMQALLFKQTFVDQSLKERCKKIKLLILDVDGVMTDGGMYFAENGDQFKKFNTKDGMVIIHLTRNDFQVAIISSGFKAEAVKRRAEMLGIQNCYVGREPKLQVLNEMCDRLGIQLDEVAIIGDDINDLEVMRNVGISFCPKDAVERVKSQADVILTKNGGEGCVRELIDDYILDEPLTR